MITLRRRYARKWSNEMPSKYVEVEYIESNGTQWIDTGVSLTEEELIGEGKGIGLDLDFMMNANSGAPFGIACQYQKTENGSTTYPGNGISLLVSKSTSNENIYFAQRHYSSYDYNARYPAFEERCKAVWRASYGQKELTVYKADGTQFSKRSNTTKSDIDDKTTECLSGLNFTLFAMRRIRPYVAQKLDYLNKSKMRLYGCKIYKPKDGDIVRDFIPVWDTQTGEYGLWDKVQGQFYGRGAGDNFSGGLPVGGN